jgi:signal peptidase II
MRKPQNFTLLVLIGIVIDHATKFLVFSKLAIGQYKVVVENWLEIRPERNFGAAFSIFHEHPGVILGVCVLALALITYIYIRVWRTAHPLLIWSLGLLLVGAIGNLIDRLVFSFVRDFIDFVHPLPIVEHWAVFNVADICITVGVFLFLIAELFYKEKQTKAAPAVNAPATPADAGQAPAPASSSSGTVP